MKYPATTIAAFIAVAILVFGHQRQEQSPKPTPLPHNIPRIDLDLIPIFSAEACIWVDSKPDWQRKVYGEEGPNGLIAIYSDKDKRSLALLHTDAGQWSVSDATKAHLDGIMQSESVLWFGEIHQVEKPKQGEIQRFAYIAKATEIHRTSNGQDLEHSISILHIVDTQIMRGRILRVQSSIKIDNNLEHENFNSEDSSYGDAIELLDRVEITPLDVDNFEIPKSRPESALIEA